MAWESVQALSKTVRTICLAVRSIRKTVKGVSQGHSKRYKKSFEILFQDVQIVRQSRWICILGRLMSEVLLTILFYVL